VLAAGPQRSARSAEHPGPARRAGPGDLLLGDQRAGRPATAAWPRAAGRRPGRKEARQRRARKSGRRAGPRLEPALPHSFGEYLMLDSTLWMFLQQRSVCCGAGPQGLCFAYFAAHRDQASTMVRNPSGVRRRVEAATRIQAADARGASILANCHNRQTVAEERGLIPIG
jgi:hypothetical protein